MTAEQDLQATVGADAADAALRKEILLGLTSPKKVLSSNLLYDATGSELFQRITNLPEYYLTRTERALLKDRAAEIVAAIPAVTGRARALVEFGASDESKAVSLLDVVGSYFSTYLAIDISPTVLDPIRTRMQVTHPHLEVRTLLADFMLPFTVRGTLGNAQAIGFLPGSTIGQYPPSSLVGFLSRVRGAFAGESQAAFVIGMDQCRDPRRVLPAYNDSAGISKAFTLNILAHVNHLTGGDLDPDKFGHEALWNLNEERVEIYLKSLLPQSARVAGQEIRFAESETIQTGMSYKYGRDRFLMIAAAAGWSSAGFWEDSEKLFAIHLLQAEEI